MTLNYRGVDYAPSLDTTIPVSPGKVGGKYRGMDWRFRHLTKPLVMHTNLDMVYRGVTVQAPVVAPQAEPEAAPQAEAETQPAMALPVMMGVHTDPVHPVADLARALLMGHQRTIKIRQQSMLWRAADEVGLVGDISAYWNKIQGKVHPSFRDSLDRSHATMS